MPNKILNTNMGLGFKRHRKYDMDFDRFGRMETSQSELRKTRQLNFRTEMKKLKQEFRSYSVSRQSYLQKEYGMGDTLGNAANTVVDGARDIAGNTIQGAGKMIGSGAGQFAGGVAGTVAGAKLGSTIGQMALPGVGLAIGGIAGGLLGGKFGHDATKTVGDTIKGVGQDIHS